MRPLDIIRQKKRYEMFNEKSKEKVLETNSFFGKYVMHFEERVNKSFTYYDTPTFDLLKSGIILYKTVVGSLCELTMANDTLPKTSYRSRNRFKRFITKMKPHDTILKYKDFLIDSFTNMFMSSISFDPEFLMRKLQVAYTIDTTSTEFRSMNVNGLKITYSFDRDLYHNYFNKVSTVGNFLTIYQLSNETTDADFADLIGKIERYCKELTPTDETKIMIARRLTANAPAGKSTPKPKDKE